MPGLSLAGGAGKGQTEGERFRKGAEQVVSAILNPPSSWTPEPALQLWSFNPETASDSILYGRAQGSSTMGNNLTYTVTSTSPSQVYNAAALNQAIAGSGGS